MNVTSEAVLQHQAWAQIIKAPAEKTMNLMAQIFAISGNKVDPNSIRNEQVCRANPS